MLISVLVVHCTALQDKLGENITIMSLNKIVDPRLMKIDDDPQKEADMPKLIFFQDVVSPELNKILKPLKQIQSSNVFQQLWASAGKILRRRKKEGIDYIISLDQVVADVWTSAYGKVQDIYERLASGDMPLREVKKLFEDIGSDPKLIKREIRVLSGGENMDWMDERLEQMKRYYRLKDFHRGAIAMLKAAKTLDLKGNFETLSSILDIVSAIIKQCKHDIIQ